MGIKTTGMAAALLFSAVALSFPCIGSAGERITKPWVAGYLPGDWQHGTGQIGILNTDDWKTVTHVMHFAAGLNDNGSLNFNYGSAGKMSETKRTEAIRIAHDNKVPILFSVNSWVDGDNYTDLTAHSPGYHAILSNATKRKMLVDSLIVVLKEGYDGLDIDLEPVRSGESYDTFIIELQAEMKKVTKVKLSNGNEMMLERPLLAVAATPSDGAAQLLAPIQDKIDQINVMTYDMATIWQCETWHDSALYDGGSKYQTTNTPMFSVDNVVKTFTTAGIPASKLGLGVSLETRIWQGGTFANSSNGALLPRQLWDNSANCATSSNRPKNWNDNTTPREGFAELMKKYYQPAYYKWENAAKVPYLSIDKTESADDMFISYNDPRSVSEKVKYMKEKNLGGLMIWELGRECLPSGNGGSLNECVPGQAGKYRPIMKAIRQTLRTGTGK